VRKLGFKGAVQWVYIGSSGELLKVSMVGRKFQ
jgi:hypothetical protein